MSVAGPQLQLLVADKAGVVKAILTELLAVRRSRKG